MTSSSIYLLIFFAAFLHALWNIIIKSLKNSLVGIAMKVFFQAEDGIRDQPRSRGLGDVYKRQLQKINIFLKQHAPV